VERLSKCVRTIHMCVRARALSPRHEEIHVNLYCLSPKRPSQTAPGLCQVQRRSHQNITPSSYAFSPVTLYIYKTQNLFLCRYHHIYIYIYIYTKIDSRLEDVESQSRVRLSCIKTSTKQIDICKAFACEALKTISPSFHAFSPSSLYIHKSPQLLLSFFLSLFLKNYEVPDDVE
jgi:hypothetical protein